MILARSRSGSENQRSPSSTPAALSIRMYSATGLAVVIEYPRISGTGTPYVWTKPSVATSLATVSRLGNAMGHGNLAMTSRPSFIPMTKVRLKPPSASFRKLTTSRVDFWTAFAATSCKAGMLNLRYLSFWRSASLYLPKRQLRVIITSNQDLTAIVHYYI